MRRAADREMSGRTYMLPIIFSRSVSEGWEEECRSDGDQPRLMQVDSTGSVLDCSARRMCLKAFVDWTPSAEVAE